MSENIAPQVTKMTAEQWEVWAENILQAEYPYYPWVVDLNPFVMELNIRNLSISEIEGMVIDMKKKETISTLTNKVRKFGGELLERANMPRSSTPAKAEEFLMKAMMQFNQGLKSVNNLDRHGKIG